MPQMSPQELRNAVLQSALSDSDFLAGIREDPSQAIRSRYGKQEYKVTVVLAKQDEFPLLIPRKTPEVARSIGKVAGAEPSSGIPTLKQFNCAVVQRVWEDPTLLTRLQTEPAASFNELVECYGVELPPGIKPLVCTEEQNECCIVIPAVVPSSGQLQEADLEAVAGGAIATGTAIAIAGIATAVADIIDDWGE